MVCAARAKQSSCSRPSPFPLLLLPANADAANAMLQALWESGIGLSAVVPATRETIAKELPWVMEREKPEQLKKPVAEATVFHPLTLWLSGMLCGLLAALALTGVNHWATSMGW